uniref:Spermatogenesis-associated protein 6 N-terminal domain-containing protein n=1 Tax=Echeneis naucrates TaxID=173247 RepID=A0A665UVL7_ECHNA
MFLHLSQVSCPGVHLSAKDDIYLSIYFMDQYCQSQCLSAVFPLLFHEKMTFEKSPRSAPPGHHPTLNWTFSYSILSSQVLLAL